MRDWQAGVLRYAAAWLGGMTFAPPDGELSKPWPLGGNDTTWLPVCRDHDRALVLLRAHLVRALDSPWGP